MTKLVSIMYDIARRGGAFFTRFFLLTREYFMASARRLQFSGPIGLKIEGDPPHTVVMLVCVRSIAFRVFFRDNLWDLGNYHEDVRLNWTVLLLDRVDYPNSFFDFLDEL